MNEQDAQKSGSLETPREYWRSLEELAGTAEFQRFLHREFPRQASEWQSAVDRREFLKLMAASLSMAGLASCTRQPAEKIVPYVQSPTIEMVPGKSLFYATAMPLGGVGLGLLVRSHMGRPIKVEGNPQHPASLGATDIFAQASILTMYDPNRSQTITYGGNISTWDKFLTDMREILDQQQAGGGAGIRILTETVTSPTLAHQINTFVQKYPQTRWHAYESVARDNQYAGASMAFGEPVSTVYHFDKADVIFSIDADFLACHGANVRYSRDFANKRRILQGDSSMNRLYALECTPTLTGAMADHRFAVPFSEIQPLTQWIAQQLGVNSPNNHPLAKSSSRPLELLVEDLKKHRGSSLVIAGYRQPPVVHAIAHLINDTLGNVGQTVTYIDPIEAHPMRSLDSIRELAQTMRAGEVELLIILGGNPAYTSPADVDFAGAMSNVKRIAHLSLYEDETSARSHWHIPEAHFLESWGDVRAYDGTVSVIQPLIEPLYRGRSEYELVSALFGGATGSAYDLVRDYWKAARPEDDFELFWRQTLHDGVMPGSAFTPKTKTQSPSTWPAPVMQSEAKHLNASKLEIVFAPDPTIWDGTFACNGWLQELPKPLTKLTWDNAVFVSPHTAARLGLKNEDVVELALNDRKVRGPIWIWVGHPDDMITLHLGYGRSIPGCARHGFRAESLRTADHFWHAAGVELRRTSERHPMACTQDHWSMEGRDIVRAATLEDFIKHPDLNHQNAEHHAQALSLYPEYEYDRYAWGMVINQNVCTGCSACVVACQAENNIPVVGKRQVIAQREMHWLRLDRYYRGDIDNPQTYHQPMLCQHCEKAPCEVVCPVAATVHDSEGLNTMVYNRCIGTRYCSNNCPYKVRRFNFFQYHDVDTPVLELLRNPDVTVRSRGVMEKCTYCVQRISAARIEAEKEGRRIKDGEVVTACQAACPTQAIIFGDINDPQSAVSKLKKEPANYSVLAELNTQPRTTYLPKLTNPNPDITEKA